MGMLQRHAHFFVSSLSNLLILKELVLLFKFRM